MPIIAIYAIIAAMLFGSGYGTCWKVMTRQVAALNAQIEVSNADAKRRLLESVTATETAERKAAETAQQLESEYVKNIELNSVVGRSLATVRMSIPSKHSNCTNTVSKGGSATIAASATTDTTELPGEFTTLLREESARADQLRAYVIEAQQFIKSNCEIKQ